jgi:hypothetical protein
MKMKIDELFGFGNKNKVSDAPVTDKPTGTGLFKYFHSDDELQAVIVKYADAISDVYRKSQPAKFGTVDFSNDIAAKLRGHIVTNIVNKYKITDENDKAELKSIVDKSISDHYLQYKINDLM